jgi:hypothetical protein
MTSNNIMLIAIGLGVCIIIILGIVIYNVIRINNMKETNKEEHDLQLVNISRNQKNLNLLNSTIIEEKKAVSEKININKNNINASKSNVLYNASIINKNIENISSNSKNITDVGDSFNTQLNDFKSKNMEDLNDIRQKNSRIQSNIGDFKYDDYLVSLDRLSEVEIKHNTLNSSVSTLNTDLKEVQRTYATRSNMHSYLDSFYNSDILPKFEFVNSKLNDLNTYKEVLETRIGSNASKFNEYYNIKGITKVLDSYVTETNFSSDLSNLRRDMSHDTSELKSDFKKVKSEVISELKSELKSDITSDFLNFKSNYTTTDNMGELGYVTNTELGNAGYVTNTELGNAGYVTNTELGNAGYVTNAELGNAGYVTNTELGNAGYVTNTTLTTDYVTNTELGNAGYVTNAELGNAGYVTNAELGAELGNAGYVTNAELGNAGYVTNTTLTTNYVTNAELGAANYVTNTELGDYYTATKDLNVAINTLGFVKSHGHSSNIQ